MNAYHKKQKQKKRKSFYRKWHRRLGFAAALLVINLSITGILLNHYEALGLHQSYITSEWILDAYNVHSPKESNCMKVSEPEQSKAKTDEVSVCQVGELIFLNQTFWRKSEAKLIGAHPFNNGIAIITEHFVYYLTKDLHLIDEYNLQESFENIPLASLVIANQIALHHNAGISIFDSDMEVWEQVSESELDQAVDLVKPVFFEPTADLLTELKVSYRHNQITHLTFIQDLHSGRIFGGLMILLTDLTAVVLIILVISGFIAWQRRKNKPEIQ